MKKIFKKFIVKLREKLELDNPDKYINGYYQLSGKQKKLWVLGLFLVAFAFSAKTCLLAEYLFGKSYPFMVVMTVSMFLAILLLTISALPVIMPFSIILFVRKGSAIALYQIWTIFFLILLLSCILKIDLTNVFPLLRLS